MHTHSQAVVQTSKIGSLHDIVIRKIGKRSNGNLGKATPAHAITLNVSPLKCQLADVWWYSRSTRMASRLELVVRAKLMVHEGQSWPEVCVLCCHIMRDPVLLMWICTFVHMEDSKEWDECPDSSGSSLELTIVGCAHTEWAPRTAGGFQVLSCIKKNHHESKRQRVATKVLCCWQPRDAARGRRATVEGGGSWELVFNSSASFIHLCHSGTHQTALWQHLTLHFLFAGNSFKRQNDSHTLNRFYSAAPVAVFQGNNMLKIRFSTLSHTFLRRPSAVYVNITAAWSWSVVSSEEMAAVSATMVSHTQSVPKPPVASLRRCFHVCKHTDWHLCTKIILTRDSLLYILAALNYETGWCLFIVFQYHLDSSSWWQQTTQAEEDVSSSLR